MRMELHSDFDIGVLTFCLEAAMTN
jgi:hypothetical protein